MDYSAVIQRTMDIIEQHLQADLSVEELARQAGFSLYHFCRLFEASVGMTLKQYMVRRRLLHAIHAIDCGSTGVDAALAYGFDTYAGFYKAFRREFGCTPSHFLKTHRIHRPCRVIWKQEESMVMTRKKAADMLRCWDLENVSLGEICYEGTGRPNEHAFYVDDHAVLKVCGHPGRLERSLALARTLQEAGLNASLPIPARDGRLVIRNGDGYFCLTTRLPGKQLSARELYEDASSALAYQTGAAIARLHKALSKADGCTSDTDTLAAVRDWALPKAKEQLQLSASFCADFLSAFSRLYPQLPRQIIHRDPSPGNIIVSEGQWGFIDFELSERNARIFDPCYAATAILSENADKGMERWLDIYHAIIRGYDNLARLSPAEREAIPYMIIANQLICVAYFSGEENFRPFWEINRQMTLWLMDSFHLL